MVISSFGNRRSTNVNVKRREPSGVLLRLKGRDELDLFLLGSCCVLYTHGFSLTDGSNPSIGMALGKEKEIREMAGVWKQLVYQKTYGTWCVVRPVSYTKWLRP